MAESHKCQICGKPATVHLTQIVGNKIQKVDLCEDCAREKGITDPEGFSLGEILTSAVTPRQGDSVVCPTCNFTSKDFKKLGVFGCPDCYTAFAPMMEPMLRSMHSDIEHKGKVPARSLERQDLMTQVARIDALLADAVREERFEDAARLRDEANTLKAKLHNEQAQ